MVSLVLLFFVGFVEMIPLERQFMKVGSAGEFVLMFDLS